MKCFLGGAAAGLALLVTLTTGQARDSRYLSQVSVPSNQALAPLGVRKLWHTIVPTAGVRDYLVKLQVLDNLIIAQTDSGGLYTLDAETGRMLWQTRFNGVSPGASVPAGVNKHSVLAIADGRLFALNRQTGALDWSIHVPHLPATSVVSNGKFVYYTAANGEVVSYRTPSTAEELRNADWSNMRSGSLVKKPEWAWGMRLITALDQQPIVLRGRLIIPQRQGNIVAMHEDKSEVIDRFQGMGTIAAQVAVADNDLYFGSLEGHVYCVEVMKEGILERWRFTADGRVVARPLPAGGHLYVASENGSLVCLDRMTGKQVWKRGNVKSLVAATKRTLLAMDRQGHLVAFERNYGLPLGSWNASQYSLPVHNATTDRAYIANGNGMIVAMRDVTATHNEPTVHFPARPYRDLEARDLSPASDPRDALLPGGASGGGEKGRVEKSPVQGGKPAANVNPPVGK